MRKERPDVTPKIENRDLRITHSFDTFNDGQGGKVEALRCDATVSYEESDAQDDEVGFRPYDPLAVADTPERPTAMTKAQETTLKNLLKKERDYALWMLNCIE